VARTPRQRRLQSGDRESGRRKGANPLAAAIFALVAGAAGVIYWLDASYDPHDEFSVPTVAMKLVPASKPEKPPPPKQPQSAKAEPPAKPAPVVRENPPTVEPVTTPAPDKAVATPSTTPVAKPEPAAPHPGQMAPAPDPDLIEASEDGDLPVVSADGRSALRVYARPHAANGDPRIAVVVGDIGLSRERSIAAIQQLPGAVTLAFSPYGKDLITLVDQARDGGHEILLQTPMEPLTFPLDDPGPHTLLTSLPAKANIERLEWVMSRFSGYTGIVSHMGSRFTYSDQHLEPILATLLRRGLMYLEAATDGQSKAGALSTSLGLPNLVATHRLDYVASLPHIDGQLKALEATARRDGYAIAIASPYPVTIERLSQWSRALPSRGLDLAPISALLGGSGKQGG
jgi:polysaccharide deacetylase 2 family uncharacterized protein YibQ